MTRLTVISGIGRAVTLGAAAELLAAAPGWVAVTHCLDHVEVGLVSRTVLWPSGHADAAVVDLQHGCVSCTLREDVLPALVEFSQRSDVGGVALVLPEAVEPMSFLEAFYSVVLDEAGRTASDHLAIDCVVAVVDAERLIPRLAVGERLADVGLAIGDDDDRTLAELIVEQVETADVILTSSATDAELTVLSLLNPDARCATTLSEGGEQLFDWERTLDRVNRARPAAMAGEVAHRGAWGFTWLSDRPFHPGRLHGCLEDLGLALRGRGTVHLASRPDVSVEWDSVGSRIALGACPAHGYAGVTAVSFVGVNGLEGAIRSRLADATLSDAEMAAGPHEWRTWPDPFSAVWQAHIDQEDV